MYSLVNIRSLKFLTLVLALFSLLATGSVEARYCTGKEATCIYNDYDNLDAWGMWTGIDLGDCDPDLVRSDEAIKEYVKQLCDLIDMKRYGDTVVVYFGEDEKVAGYSMTQLIETSLISGHFVNETNSVYIDVFSCKKYDPYVVAEFTKEFFAGGEYVIHTVLRK